MEALIATAGNLINVLPAPLKALTAEVVSRIKFIRLRAVAVWFTNLSVFSVLSNRAISSCNGGFGSTTWCTWHSTGLSPGSVPSLAFLLSISSIFFSARSMCVCLVVPGFVMFCAFSGLVGWLCQLPFLFPGVPSMSNTPESNFKLGGNLTEWHSTGLSPGSVPSLAFFLSISSTFFSARSMCLCLVVTGFVMFCAFSGLVGWLCQMAFHWALSWKRSQPCILPFYFFHFLLARSMCVCLVVTGFVMLSIFWAGLVVVPNGIPLGSLLEAFPALHSSFLFLPFSFSKKHVCMFGCHWFCYVVYFLGWFGCCAKWHSTGLSPGSVPSLAFFLSISSIFFSARSMCVCLVVTEFVMFCAFSGLVGWLCQLPFLFPGVPSMSNTPKIISNLGETSRNGIPLGSLLEVFPALHFSFLFLQPSFQQEACVYVWLSLVLSCFVHFLGWLGGCVSCLFCFQGFRACRIPRK